jgi:outer membrane protein OmpA-like peptidoglycan-associated protein
LVVPGAALLITLGLFGYAISSGKAGDGASSQSAPSIAQNAPAASPRSPSQLAPGNENGAIASSGTGANGANPAAPGDLAVKQGWIKNLSAAFGGFRSQDSRTLFAGDEFNVRGTRPHADAKMPQFVVASLSGSGTAKMRIVLSISKLDSSGNESAGLPNQAALDFPVIIFPANSAKVPLRSIPVLRRVAEQIKQLPPGTVVQLNGYTHSMRMSAADMELSQLRADSVHLVLIQQGVSPAMLSAKGYGSASLSASTNGTMEGRSSTRMERPQRNDRRVEFHVVQQRP